MCSRSQLNILTSAIVKEYRKVYGDTIDSVLLYGSYARGDKDDTSDIDIVAIVHGERLSLQEKLKKIWDSSAEMSLMHDVIISPAVIPFDEFEKYKGILPYYRNISEEGIAIGLISKI